MANIVNDRVLDYGLDILDTEADQIDIVSADPTTYTEATSTYSLGAKNFGVGSACGSPAAASPNGRKVTTAAITDGVASGSDVATGWAVVDTVNMRLLANGDLAAPQTLTSGNPFTLDAFDISIPNQ